MRKRLMRSPGGVYRVVGIYTLWDCLKRRGWIDWGLA